MQTFRTGSTKFVAKVTLKYDINKYLNKKKAKTFILTRLHNNALLTKEVPQLSLVATSLHVHNCILYHPTDEL